MATETVLQEQAMPVKLRPKRISEADFILNLSGHNHNEWVAKVPVGTSKSDIMEPAFWSHVAAKLRPMDKIETWAIDGSFYGEFIVLYADNLNARLDERFFKTLESDDKGADADIYFVKWVSPPVQFGVIRKSDNERVKDGFKTKADAVVWMQQHVKSIGK